MHTDSDMHSIRTYNTVDGQHELQSSLQATCPEAHRSPHITRLWYTFRSSLNSLTKSSISFPLPLPFPFAGDVGRSVDEDCTKAEASASDSSSWAVVACRRRINKNCGVNRWNKYRVNIQQQKQGSNNMNLVNLSLFPLQFFPLPFECLGFIERFLRLTPKFIQTFL